MQEYDKNKITTIFDKLTSERERIITDEDIWMLVSEIAFEKLELSSDDYLLDMGCGNGEFSIRAAKICKRVIGIDLCKKRIENNRLKSQVQNIENIDFILGAFEDWQDIPKEYNKVLFNYSLHHLPDVLKQTLLNNLIIELKKPFRIVIGDIIFFDEPDKFKNDFEKIGYDGGETDIPASVEFYNGILTSHNVKHEVIKVHPLAGVIRADF
jgi:2-polyprenyl-3-methyl-5-hydroxy-6-metoxy-1,4-benzoquinol methylase